MPGLDGLSAARQIASERLAAVLILTAFSQRDLVEQARDAGRARVPGQAVPEERPAAGDRGRARPARRAVLAGAPRRGPRGAARVPQGHRPREGPAHGRARLRRAVGLAVHPDPCHERASEGRRDRPARRRRASSTSRSMRSGERPGRGQAYDRPRWPKLLLLDGHSLAFRAFYALPADLATPDGHDHERGVRVHVDAHEGPRRRAARLPRRRVRCSGPHVPRRHGRRLQGRAQGHTRRLPLADAADPRGARRARDPGARDRGRRGRRRDRDAGDAGRGRGHRRRRRHRRPRCVPARRRTRT